MAIPPGAAGAAQSPVLHSRSGPLHPALLLRPGLALIALHGIQDLVRLALVHSRRGRGRWLLLTAAAPAAPAATRRRRWRRGTKALRELQIPLGPLRCRLQHQGFAQPVRRLRQQLGALRGVRASRDDVRDAEVIEGAISERRVERLRGFGKRAASDVVPSGLQRRHTGIVERGVPRTPCPRLLEECGGCRIWASRGQGALARRGTLRDERRGNSHEQEQCGAAARQREREEHERRGEQRNPAARNQIAGARLAARAPLERGEQLTNGAGLIGHVGVDDGSVAGLRDLLERGIVALRLDDPAGLIQLVLDERTGRVPNGDPNGIGAAFRGDHQPDALFAELARRRDGLLQLFARVLAIGEQDEDPVTNLAGSEQQLGALREHGREAGPALAREVRVEPVEVKLDRAAIHRERREDVAPAREGDEPNAITLAVLHEPPRLADRTLQPVRPRILGEHRTTDVHGEQHAERTRLGRYGGAPSTRAGEREERKERRDTNGSRPEPAAGPRRRGELRRPGAGEVDATTPCPPQPGADDERDDGGGKEQVERLEDHGSRTSTVVASSSSRPSARSPATIKGSVLSSCRA